MEERHLSVVMYFDKKPSPSKRRLSQTDPDFNKFNTRCKLFVKLLLNKYLTFNFYYSTFNNQNQRRSLVNREII